MLTEYIVITSCVILFIALIIVFIISTRKNKGIVGEAEVKALLYLDKAKYTKIYHNYCFMLDDKNTCQIDHLIVSDLGIFVIETKNYSGDIYGKVNDLHFTQFFKESRKSYKFYSPIKQILSHCKKIGKLLDLKEGIYPCVVFSQNNNTHIDCDYCIGLKDLRKYLNTFNEVKFSNKEVNRFIEILDENLLSEEEFKKMHLKSVEEAKAKASRKARL